MAPGTSASALTLTFTFTWVETPFRNLTSSHHARTHTARVTRAFTAVARTQLSSAASPNQFFNNTKVDGEDHGPQRGGALNFLSFKLRQPGCSSERCGEWRCVCCARSTCAGTWRTAGKSASWCGGFRGSLRGTRLIKFNACSTRQEQEHFWRSIYCSWRGEGSDRPCGAVQMSVTVVLSVFRGFGFGC